MRTQAQQLAERAPAVAGMFYPGAAQELALDIADMMETSGAAAVTFGFPKLLVVPHAGYIYSGPVAASAYDRLRSARGIVKRVVLLGPCHRVPVRGLALPATRVFVTPLGRIPIDEDAVRTISGLAQVAESEAAHFEEHSLEVQLPFLQTVLGEFALLPLVVGDASAEEVAQVIECLWGGSETIIVISSDLSHYLPYDEARRVDGATAQAIVGFDTGIGHDQACGATPLTGALLAAKRKGLSAAQLDLRNSGDTAGGKGRVVGYGSFAFAEKSEAFTNSHGRELLGLARQAIGAALGLNTPPVISRESWLHEWRATFVTLTIDGSLRGCIGSLEARRPLAEDVIANARAAAFEDPRFDDLSPEEFAQLQIEVSLLSAPKRIVFENQADLIDQLVPGRDGVILECDGRRATFLPQVWESLPQPDQFIAELKHKAGLPSGLSISRCKLLRYAVLKWTERGIRNEQEVPA